MTETICFFANPTYDRYCVLKGRGVMNLAQDEYFTRLEKAYTLLGLPTWLASPMARLSSPNVTFDVHNDRLLSPANRVFVSIRNDTATLSVLRRCHDIKFDLLDFRGMFSEGDIKMIFPRDEIDDILDLSFHVDDFDEELKSLFCNGATFTLVFSRHDDKIVAFEIQDYHVDCSAVNGSNLKRAFNPLLLADGTVDDANDNCGQR